MTEKTKRPVTGEGLRELFGGAADFVAREVDAGGHRLLCCFLDGLTSGGDIADFVLRPLARAPDAPDEAALLARALAGGVWNAVAERADDLDAAAEKLVNGFCAVVFPALGAAAVFEVKTPVKRGPEPPMVENTVKGAKDSFSETVRLNTSLVRRHLRTPSLRFAQSSVGRRSGTNVTVAWIEGLTDPALVARLRARLDEIDVDGLLTPASVEEYLTGSRKTAFPLLQYTERTDKFCRALLEGRAGVLVDGLPMGWLLPVNVGRLMESPEDLGRGYVAASCLRVIRYAALLVSLLLPGLYLCIAAFNQEMLPTPLLLAIIESKKSVPFPTVFEVLGLLLSFEILQEAGVQLPRSIGQTVSIIGGLVVGTAAVEAKLVSPAALIAVAAAGVCGYALPERDFADAVRVWRFSLAALSAVAGLIGLTAGVLALVIHLSGLESCGRPYLAPFSDASAGGAVLRRRLVTEKFRDRALRPLDRRKQR